MTVGLGGGGSTPAGSMRMWRPRRGNGKCAGNIFGALFPAIVVIADLMIWRRPWQVLSILRNAL